MSTLNRPAEREPGSQEVIFFACLQSNIIDRQGKVDQPKYDTTGNQVVVTGNYTSEGYANKPNSLFTVEKNKITIGQIR
jgi:hypothetical protein